MTWCKNDFRLEIYNKQIGEFVKCPARIFRDICLAYDGQGFIELVTSSSSLYLTKIFGRLLKRTEIIPFCIKQGWINDEWQRFADWYWKNSDIINNFLFRSINPELYDKLMLLGSTTTDLSEEYELLAGTIPDKRFTDAGLHRSDYIWADKSVSKAWSYANKYNPSIIAAYKPEFFKQFGRGDLSYVWIKIDKNIDLKDTVEAIFRVYYVY